MAKRPKPGDVVDGFAFLGGDPSVQENWREMPTGLAKTIDDAGRALASGATFGFADEISAGLSALPALWPGGRDYGEQYDREIAYERARDRAIPPAVSIPGEVVGSIATAIPLGIGAGAARVGAGLMPQAATKGGRLLQAAAGGSALGALSGAGHAETGDRLGGAVVGGGIGAVIPGAMQAVAGPVRAVSQLMAPKSAAARRLGQTLTQGGLTPQQAQARMRELGPDAALADVSETTMSQAQAALSKSPARIGQVSEFLEGRVAEAPSRLSEYVGKLAGGKNFRKTVDEMTEAQQAASRPLYQQAAQEVPTFTSDAVNDAMRNTQVRKAYNTAKKVLNVKKDPKGGMPYDLVDKTYKYLGDEAAKQTRSGAKMRARDINAARIALKDAIVEENPTYGKALNAFSGPAQLKDLADKGTKFWNQSVDDVAVDVGRLTSQSERDAYLLGITKAIQDRIARGNYGSDLSRQLAGSPAKRALLKTVFPSEEAFDAFMGKLMSEGTFARTRNVVLSGSQTQPRQAASDALGKMAAESAITGQPVPWVTELTKRMFTGDMSPGQADEVLKLLLTKGADAQRAITTTQPGLSVPIGMSPGAVGALSGLAYRE